MLCYFTFHEFDQVEHNCMNAFVVRKCLPLSPFVGPIHWEHKERQGLWRGKLWRWQRGSFDAPFRTGRNVLLRSHDTLSILTDTQTLRGYSEQRLHSFRIGIVNIFNVMTATTSRFSTQRVVETSHLINVTLHQWPPGRLVDSLDGRPAAQLGFANEAVMTEVGCITFFFFSGFKPQARLVVWHVRDTLQWRLLW